MVILRWHDGGEVAVSSHNRREMRESWDRRIERAKRLALVDEAARQLLTFYAVGLRLQRGLANPLTVSDSPLTGSLDRDLDRLRPALPPFLEAIERSGPILLAREARAFLSGPTSACDGLLTAIWRHPSDRQFV